MKSGILNRFCLVVFSAVLVFSSAARAADTVLYNFALSPDSNNSYSTPIHDPYGNLYGTSAKGGTHGYGTVWVLCAPGLSGSDLYPCTTGLLNWTEYVLYNFRGPTFNDGANPYSTLVLMGCTQGERLPFMARLTTAVSLKRVPSMALRLVVAPCLSSARPQTMEVVAA